MNGKCSIRWSRRLAKKLHNQRSLLVDPLGERWTRRRWYMILEIMLNRVRSFAADRTGLTYFKYFVICRKFRLVFILAMCPRPFDRGAMVELYEQNNDDSMYYRMFPLAAGWHICASEGGSVVALMVPPQSAAGLVLAAIIQVPRNTVAGYGAFIAGGNQLLRHVRAQVFEWEKEWVWV